MAHPFKSQNFQYPVCMSAKPGKKPLITANWLPIETIHGVPNILTSRVLIAQMKKAREAEGKPPAEQKWCMFCGRPFMSIQALKGHLKGCEGRKAYQATKADGWNFVIGSETFNVQTLRWSWLREAASLEAEMNQRIADGAITEEGAAVRFNYFVLGLQTSIPNVVATLSSIETAAGAG